MWAIRILSGPQAGQIIPLRPGKTILGRGPSCEVKLNSQGISKEHASVFVSETKVILSDMNSRNGTFVNGVRIQNQKLTSGDKLAFHDVLCDILSMPEHALLSFQRPQHQPWNQPQGSVGLHPAQQVSQAAPQSAPGLMGAYQNLLEYIDNVAMPGVYHVARSMEYRWVLAAMVGLYLAVVTVVVMIPTTGMIKSSVQSESQRRAKSIARSLAATNRQALLEKNEIAITTRAAEIEDGVSAVLIISAKDGSVIAPANLRGGYADKTFVVRARKSDKEIVENIDDSLIGASVPIVAYNSDLRDASAIAYAVVFYDVESTAAKSDLIFGLFIQIFAIAIVLGIALFFFLLKVVEHPIVELNAKLDDALREGRDDLKTSYRFPALERLASNINSALSRIGSSNGQEMPVAINRDAEAINVIGMIGDAAMALNALDDRIIISNSAFDQLVGGGVDLRGRTINDIPDSTLQLNLRDLVPRLRGTPDRVATADLPFSGQPHQLRAQAICGANGEPAYYIVTILYVGEEAA
jgi:hypothetical protein